MSEKGRQRVLTGLVIEERETLSLDELCRFCTVREERIVALVEEGILHPAGAQPRTWRFPGTSTKRAARAFRLQRDLELNLAGVALVLDLLDEIEHLRGRLRMTED